MRVLKTSLVAVAMLTVAGAASAQQKREIAIGIGGSGLASGYAVIVKELGLFEKHGIIAKTTWMESANAATTALISKSLDVAASGIGEIVLAQGRGQKVILVINGYDGLPGTLVLSNAAVAKTKVSPTAPVADRVKALEGLTIATPSPTSLYTAVLKGAAAGVNFRLTHMGTDVMPTSLIAGAIDGYMAAGPTWAPPVVKGAGVVWISGPKKEFPEKFSTITTGGLHAMEDYAKANPDLMKGLIAAMADFRQAIKERPADVKAAALRAYPNVDAATMDILFNTEIGGWQTKTLTAADMKNDIQVIKSQSSADLSALDRIEPGSLLYKP
jgi:ABC-type nitrate/sulfonate/bicarbonate transport system substrate-binding protein